MRVLSRPHNFNVIGLELRIGRDDGHVPRLPNAPRPQSATAAAQRDTKENFVYRAKASLIELVKQVLREWCVEIFWNLEKPLLQANGALIERGGNDR